VEKVAREFLEESGKLLTNCFADAANPFFFSSDTVPFDL